MRGLPEEVIGADGIVLRPPRLEDADDVALACADPAIQRYVQQLPSPYTRQDAVTWITEGRESARAQGALALVVADPDTDRVLGSAGIHHVWMADGFGEVGYWVAPWARGRGVATTSAVALTRWAHGHGLYRLELLTEVENWPSQRVAIAAGYHREGIRRAAGRSRDGSRHDLVVWSRLPTDPPPPSARLLPDLPGGSLTDGVVHLRPLWSGDADDVYHLRLLPESVASSVPPVAPERDDVRRRCAEAPARWLAGDGARLTIRDAASGEFAGEVGIYIEQRSIGEAMVGYGLLPAWRGRGYATRAVRLLAGWAMGEAGFQRLVAATTPDNVASQRVLERAGFHREGYQRSRLPGAGGTRIDDVAFALLPEDLTDHVQP